MFEYDPEYLCIRTSPHLHARSKTYGTINRPVLRSHLAFEKIANAELKFRNRPTLFTLTTVH